MLGILPDVYLHTPPPHTHTDTGLYSSCDVILAQLGIFPMSENAGRGRSALLRFYLSIFRERGREVERERNINVCCLLRAPYWGPEWPLRYVR